MAKIGKKDGAFDPFKGNENTSNALENALRDLEPSPTVQSVNKKQSIAPSRLTRDLPPKEIVIIEREKRFSKRFQATRNEAAEFESAALRLSGKAGTRVDFSKITRALWQVYLQHEEDILKNVTDTDQLPHPGTGDPVGLAKLEEELATLVNRGFMVASRRPTNLK